MPFPQPSEYDDAIQNPGTAFADAELKQGVNDGPLRFGMPGPVASGNFAVVYRFRCGARRYAVKCFTRQPPKDQEKRFSSIHNHLLTSRLNCATEFQFLPRGILVRGTFYPILKMEWLEAPTLLDFVPKNIHDRDVFRQLSEAFLAVCGELRKNQIAHGDLQHGNLLVLAGGLKIIDYDGMCVPGTAGLPSEEDGLPHYQHPCRRGGRLSPNFDHFPSLVIWISLYALSVDPSLWMRYVREDERLLFSKDDFANPQGSAIFRELLSYGDERLSKAVTALRDACAARDLANVPPLTDIVSSVSVVIDPEWWREQVPSGAGTSSDELVTPSKHGQPDWMQPDQPPPLPARFGYSIIWDRVFAYTYVIAVVVAGTAVFVGAIPAALLIIGVPGIGALVGARLLGSYKESPLVKQKTQCTVKLKQATLQLADYEVRLRQWKTDQESLIEEKARPVKEQEAKLTQLQARCRQQQAEFDVQLQGILQTLSTERQQIDSRERQALQAVTNEVRQMDAALAERLRRIDADNNKTAADATVQIDDLRREKEKKKEARFKALCDEFVRAELMQIPIRAASVASLTGTNIHDLRDKGIRYAGDFINCDAVTSITNIGAGSTVYFIVKADGSRIKIPGIGAKRAIGLIDWRRELVRRALGRAPTSLPQPIIDAIERETEERRQDLTRRVIAANAEASRLRNEAQATQNMHRTARVNIEANVRKTATASRAALDRRKEQERQNAAARKAEALSPFEREIWQLQSVINPAKHKVDQLRGEYHQLLAGTKVESGSLRFNVSALQREITQFHNIHAGRYLARVLAFASE